METIRRLRILGKGKALRAQPRPTTEAIMATPMRHVSGRLCLAAAAVLFAGAAWAAQTQAGAQASGQGAGAADPPRTSVQGRTPRAAHPHDTHASLASGSSVDARLTQPPRSGRRKTRGPLS